MCLLRACLTWRLDYQVSSQQSSKNLYFGGKLIPAEGVTVATGRLGSVRAFGFLADFH